MAFPVNGGLRPTTPNDLTPVPANTRIMIESILFPDDKLPAQSIPSPRGLKIYESKAKNDIRVTITPLCSPCPAPEISSLTVPPLDIPRSSDSAVSLTTTSRASSYGNLLSRSSTPRKVSSSVAHVHIHSSVTRRLAFGDPKPEEKLLTRRLNGPLLITMVVLLIVAGVVGGIVYVRWKEIPNRNSPVQQGESPKSDNVTANISLLGVNASARSVGESLIEESKTKKTVVLLAASVASGNSSSSETHF